MMEPQSLQPPREVACGDDYPINPDTATSSLAAVLRERINRTAPLCFADYMNLVLYHPACGYYARGIRQVGRSGDFFTSVSVGPVFGHLLARRFLRHWMDCGKPGRWRVIECGAHDGTLAADVLGCLADLEPAAFACLEYVIPETLPLLQVAQRQTLQNFAGRVRFVANAAELMDEPLPGVAFGNEVLDALPCHLVEWHAGRWFELHVKHDDADRLVFFTDEIQNETLSRALRSVGENFPEGYRTEVRTNYGDFLTPLSRALCSGLMLWVDYGFERPEYYHPDRREGTLRTFSRHRAGDDPLAAPGESDITAHVDFTAVMEAAAKLGWEQVRLRSQGSWLTEVAREWLLAMEGNPRSAELRQFQTLMHPAHLGARFHVLEFTRE